MNSRQWTRLLVASWVFARVFSAPGAVQMASGGYAGAVDVESHGNSFGPLISTDGRYVVFGSLADDLIPGTPDATADVFRADRLTGEIQLVSDLNLPPHGRKAEAHSFTSSADAQHVAYITFVAIILQPQLVRPVTVVRDLSSESTVVLEDADRPPEFIYPGQPVELAFSGNGVKLFMVTEGGSLPADTNQFSSIRYFNLTDGSLMALNQPIPVLDGSKISPQTQIGENLVASPNGRFLAFQSSVTPFPDFLREEILVYDTGTETLSQASIHSFASADTDTTGGSFRPAISGDGRWVVFESRSTNLVANDANGALRDVFLRDRVAQTTTLVSTNSSGVSSVGANSASAAISEDGRWTVFFSDADNLVAGDNNQTADVFLRNNLTGDLTRISAHPDWHGLMARGAVKPIISPDGEWILYQASGSGVFLYQRSLGQNTLITSDCEEDVASMTPDGEFVALTAQATTMNPASSSSARNVYVWSRSSGQVELISKRHVSYDRRLPDGDSHLYAGGVSDDGSRYVFRSSARNLSEDRLDAYEALWVRDLSLGTNILIAINDGNFRSSGPRPFSEAVMSGNGRFVAYLSQRTNLPPEGLALNGWDDIFVHDLQTGLKHLVTESRTASFDGSSNAVHLGISNDGNRLVFTSNATNLSTELGGSLGIYMWDRATDTIKRMDDPLVGPPGDCVNGPSLISPDGSRVAFIAKDSITGYCLLEIREWSAAESLTLDSNMSVRAFAWNSVGDQLAMVGFRPDLGGDHLFLHDFESGQTETKLSISGGTFERGFSFDRNLSYMAYADVYWWNAPILIREIGTGQSFESPGQYFYRKDFLKEPGTTMSPDGRFVVFKASRLNANSPPQESEKRMHLRVLDRVNRTISILDRSIDDGSLFDVPPGRFLMAPNVSRVLFESYQSDLVSRDDNLAMDIFAVDLIATDSDQDGIDDAWELAYFDTLDRDGSGDSDSDGVSDLGEYQAGTVPVNSTSVLSVTEMRFVNTNERLLSWRSVAGKRYRVQMKPTVDASAWLDRSDVIAAIGETTSFTDIADAGSELPETRFYRVELVE